MSAYDTPSPSQGRRVNNNNGGGNTAFETPASGASSHHHHRSAEQPMNSNGFDSDASLSSVGALTRDLPPYASSPPIEAVVFAWGVNEDGQLGLDGAADVPSPKVVEALLGTRLRGRAFNRCPLVAGSRCTLALDAEGRVLAWGWNARGTLGHGPSKGASFPAGAAVPSSSASSSSAERKPRRVSALLGHRIVQAATGGWHCLALDSEGCAWAWGGNEYSQCGSEPESTGRDVSTPIRVRVPGLEENLRFKQVAAGGTHSAALTEDGRVWTWGEPWGDFSVVMSRAPRPVPLSPSLEGGGGGGGKGIGGASASPSSPPFFSPSSTSSPPPSPYDSSLPYSRPRAAKLACGAFHTLVLLEGGEVRAWGINDFGQLGTGSTTYETQPAKVVGLPEGGGGGAADIAAGGWHSLALSSEGGVFVWGRGEYGRLGLGDRTGASRLTAERVRALDGVPVVQASAGGTHTAALTRDGRLFTWGRGSFGRLGTGDERDAHAPVAVSLPGGPDRWRVVSVACGGRHTIALALPDNARHEREEEEEEEEQEEEERRQEREQELEREAPASAPRSPLPVPSPPAVPSPPPSRPSPGPPLSIPARMRRPASGGSSGLQPRATGPVFDSDGGIVTAAGGGTASESDGGAASAAAVVRRERANRRTPSGLLDSRDDDDDDAGSESELARRLGLATEEQLASTAADADDEEALAAALALRLATGDDGGGIGGGGGGLGGGGDAGDDGDEDDNAAEEEVENASLARTPPGGVAVALARVAADAAELEAMSSRSSPPPPTEVVSVSGFEVADAGGASERGGRGRRGGGRRGGRGGGGGGGGGCSGGNNNSGSRGVVGGDDGGGAGGRGGGVPPSAIQ